jgi:hypothetical protein
VIGVQITQFKTGVGHTAYFNDSSFEQSFVARVIIADKLSGPTSQELSGVLAAATFGKVVDHDRQLIVFAAGVTPKISSVSAFEPRLQHRHGRLIGMKYVSAQQSYFHRSYQRLLLLAAGTDPLRQCRARDVKA